MTDEEVMAGDVDFETALSSVRTWSIWFDDKKAALAERMHARSESASIIAATLGVSRATVYRVLSDPNLDSD